MRGLDDLFAGECGAIGGYAAPAEVEIDYESPVGDASADRIKAIFISWYYVNFNKYDISVAKKVAQK